MINKIYYYSASLISVLLLVLCISCGGGGTRGTGTAKVEGIVIGSDSQPIAEIAVSAEMLSQDNMLIEAATDSTDSEGKFSVEFEEIAEKLKFHFSKTGIEDDVVIESLPEGFSRLETRFKVDRGEVSIEKTTFKQEESHHKAPQVKPTSNDNEGEEQSADATPMPVEATPTVEPILSPTSTSTYEGGSGNGGNGNNGNNDNGGGAGGSNKVTLCHRQGQQRRTIEVPINAVANHLAHGDTLGVCPAQ